jgi:hypothetical protein
MKRDDRLPPMADGCAGLCELSPASSAEGRRQMSSQNQEPFTSKTGSAPMNKSRSKWFVFFALIVVALLSLPPLFFRRPIQIVGSIQERDVSTIKKVVHSEVFSYFHYHSWPERVYGFPRAMRFFWTHPISEMRVSSDGVVDVWLQRRELRGYAGYELTRQTNGWAITKVYFY